MLTAGIVGLPNVGKSTLFKAITNSQVLIENYPFATIKPNIATCPVSDPRVKKITEIFQPEKIVPTVLEMHDIAGLVKGAHKGEGLGNQFLANIREVDAICQVVRCFEDSNITHVANKIDPVDDFEVIELELIFADQQVIKNRLEKTVRKVKVTNDKAALKEIELLKKINQALDQGVVLRNQKLTEDEQELVKPFNFLTIKPVVVIANIGERDLSNKDNKHLEALENYAKEKGLEVISVCAKIESEIAELEDAEKTEYLKMLDIEMSGIEQIVLATYKLLNLATFFTAGPKEVHAWTFIKGMKAPECAGIIHTDFMKGFIRAEIYNYQDLIISGDEKKVKDAGKLRIEGKNYQMQDGDICHFRFNV
ncbi:Ribosome-binding ATPase YchF [Spiroplasma platyhelix PALS-1]|nr:redox-regulated ATPase YchF [Spiroplasma platyhelix]MBE4704250.1 Ribosome-binding ATPase YchF [Spiroplasma platyhelix PALS-1]UJB28834.1 GTP-dependent nucleic acid-binding protein EngD [Spiroplasma platyhelix PALS-1]